MKTATTTSTDRLAEFVAHLSLGDIPGDVVEHAQLCLLDTIGCGLFGSTLPWSRIVREAGAAAAPGQGTVSVWGTSEMLTPADAALANGTAVHAFELDDLHPRSIVHPGSVVVSAVWAVAPQAGEVSGADFLVAMIAGYEVAARVGMTMGAAHLVAGWHPTGTHGVLGAAAGAGRLLGLDSTRLREALGTAGSQAAGLMAAQYESMVKRLHAGRASSNGVWSALLAERGFTGIRDLFEADYGGYGSTFAPRFDPGPLTNGLGEEWETARVGFKPYSTNGSCHPSIDCLRELKTSHGLDLKDVDRIDIEASTATVHHVGWPYVPDSVTTAQMNLPFIAAVVLADGEAFVDQFTPERIVDPTLVEAASRVHVVAAEDIDALGDTGRHVTRLVLTLRDGRQLRAERAFAHGSARDPLTRDETLEKFRRLAGTVLTTPGVTALEESVLSLRDAPSLAQLAQLLRPSWTEGG